ncbi:MAG TPA: RodZ domain-containing protein [Bacilli bacterium]|nr:RodZ domain-containing protein [Bacilli bacterium]
MQEIGKELQEAREAQGMTLEDVQQGTKIRTRYLEAIEAGELDTLPGMVYARGFIKSYAEFLGINGQELLERHNLAAEADRAPVEPVASAPQPKVKTKRSALPLLSSRLPQVVAIIALLAVFTAGYLYFVNQDEEHGAVNQEPKVQGETSPTDVSEPAPQPEPTPAPAPEPPKPKVAVTQAGQAAHMTSYKVTGVEKMELLFSADRGNCWVDVKGDDGKSLYTGTLQKGQKQTWVASKVLTVKTGNSQGVSMTMNGQAVNFPPQTGGYTYQFAK